MVAELWFYPDGSRILELSTKCTASDAFQVAAEARVFLTEKGVSLEGKQETKTKAALTFFSKQLRAASAASGTPNSPRRCSRTLARVETALGGVVRCGGPRPAVAADARPLRDPRLRGHAPADAGRSRRPALRRLARALADRRVAGRRLAGRRDPRVAGARLQPARGQPPSRRRKSSRATAGPTTSPSFPASARTRPRRSGASRSARTSFRST